MENIRVNQIEDLEPGQIILDCDYYLIKEIDGTYITAWDLKRSRYDELCACDACLIAFSIVNPDDVKKLKLEWL